MFGENSLDQIFIYVVFIFLHNYLVTGLSRAVKG
jgi:hypothetical protein